ncbi:MAG: four helix bundle protein [Prolixibacteraceae bacterium]|nr:four helix bundle protein [Prolixibacteraceae bacterium]
MTPRELEDRLISFAVNIIRLSDGIKPSIAGNNLSGQIVRSSSSTALNYGEAQSAESPKDFVHKLRICLKEMRETFINLRIIDGAKLHADQQLLNQLKTECNELVSIFVKSIETSKRKQGTLPPK